MEFLSYCGGLVDFQSLIAKSGKLLISKHTSGFLRYRSNCHNSCHAFLCMNSWTWVTLSPMSKIVTFRSILICKLHRKP